MKQIISLSILFLLWAMGLAANTEFDVRAHYDRSVYKIPVRDGIKLHTVVYSASPYGLDEYHPPERMAPSDEFLEDGYIVVFRDGRGTYQSEGEWINLRPVRSDDSGIDEATDSYDTIEWLATNISGNSGRLGQWGISHPGWYTVMGIIGAHPALKAASPSGDDI